MIWLLGFIPVWLLGVVDYQGSRLMVLERLRWPTSAEIVRVMETTIQRHGAPTRLLTDNGSVFKSAAFGRFLESHNVEHTFIRPGRPQTNGRIERLFWTFKETVFHWVWVFKSIEQIDRFSADFVQFYNRDRPHSSWGGRTPDEAYFNRSKQYGATSRVRYFDGHLCWYKFG